MKIIIIILICLFFSLTITPINEFITSGPPPAPSPKEGPPPASIKKEESKPAPQPESGLQTQVNMLSTQITTTNAIALEAKNKVDDISSQINQLKEQLKKAPDV
jgi:peptidoglycan hydrolase CwlO-like protein